VQYSRPRLAEHLASTSLTRVAISTAEAEAADQLATWTVATLCRSLSLPNILTVLTGVHASVFNIVCAPPLVQANYDLDYGTPIVLSDSSGR